jgi:hypothetical protein
MTLPESNVLRGQLTIAEDALREIASANCGMEWDEEHGGYDFDTDAPRRVAEGALKRIREYADDK